MAAIARDRLPAHRPRVGLGDRPALQFFLVDERVSGVADQEFHVRRGERVHGRIIDLGDVALVAGEIDRGARSVHRRSDHRFLRRIMNRRRSATIRRRSGRLGQRAAGADARGETGGEAEERCQPHGFPPWLRCVAPVGWVSTILPPRARQATSRALFNIYLKVFVLKCEPRHSLERRKRAYCRNDGEQRCPDLPELTWQQR